MPQALEYQNGGFVRYPDRVTSRTFFRATERYTEKVTVKAGNVLKAFSFVESIRGGADAGKVKPHTGLSEAAIAKFAAITSGQTVILGGLTFTAGSAGASATQLALAWSNIADGTTAANANIALLAAGIATTVGTFTAGTFSGWNTYPHISLDSAIFRSTSFMTNVTDLAATGTGTAPTISTVQGTGAVLLQPIAGVTLFDVDASAGDVETVIFTEASFYAEALCWAANPNTDFIYDSLGNPIACSAYNTGVFGPDLATTRRLQKQFVEQSEFLPLGFLSETPATGGTSYNG